jgi:hypothetical protein
LDVFPSALVAFFSVAEPPELPEEAPFGEGELAHEERIVTAMQTAMANVTLCI